MEQPIKICMDCKTRTADGNIADGISHGLCTMCADERRVRSRIIRLYRLKAEEFKNLTGGNNNRDFPYSIGGISE